MLYFFCCYGQVTYFGKRVFNSKFRLHNVQYAIYLNIVLIELRCNYSLPLFHVDSVSPKRLRQNPQTRPSLIPSLAFDSIDGGQFIQCHVSLSTQRYLLHSQSGMVESVHSMMAFSWAR